MSQGTPLPHIQSSFFLRRLDFASGTLAVDIGDDHAVHGTVVFDHVRSFLFFKEGDFFREIAKYEHTKLIAGDEPTVGVYRVTSRPVLDLVLGGRLDSEHPEFFWVSTPDECLEVVAFSDPTLEIPNASLRARAPRTA